MARNDVVAQRESPLVRGSRVLPGLLPAVEADNLAEDLLVNADPDGRGGVALVRLPSAVERIMLQKRGDELRQTLEPIGGGSTNHPGGAAWSKARQALAAVFAGRSARRDVNVNETLDIYLGWLSDLPMFAIVEACLDIGKGRARLINPATGKLEYISPTFDISATIVHLLASAIAEKKWDKVGRIDKVLRVTKVQAPMASPEERERVSAQLQDLAKSMKRGMGGRDEAVERKAEEGRLARAAAMARDENAAAWRALGYDPIFNADGSISSPALLKSLRQWPPAAAVPYYERRE